MKSPLNISIKPTKAGWFLIYGCGLFTLVLLFSTFSWALEPINKGLTRVPFRLFVSLVLAAGIVTFVLGVWVLRRRKVRAFNVQR
jgi:hypothetical protein